MTNAIGDCFNLLYSGSFLGGVDDSECAIEVDGIACSAVSNVIYLENFCCLAVANNAKCVSVVNARVGLDRQVRSGVRRVCRKPYTAARGAAQNQLVTIFAAYAGYAAALATADGLG